MGKLTATGIVERALEISDAEGVDAVTIRRLATDLGVTPMALYWHFKNKELLLQGMANHLVAGFVPKAGDDRPWMEELRELIEGLVRVLRRHPSAKDVLEQVDHSSVPNFLTVWDKALGLARTAGFSVEESCLISKYLLTSAIAIADAPGRKEPDPERARVKLLALQSLPIDRYPHLVEMAGPMIQGMDPDFYDSFGVDLLLSGVQALSSRA